MIACLGSIIGAIFYATGQAKAKSGCYVLIGGKHKGKQIMTQSIPNPAGGADFPSVKIGTGFCQCGSAYGGNVFASDISDCPQYGSNFNSNYQLNNPNKTFGGDMSSFTGWVGTDTNGDTGANIIPHCLGSPWNVPNPPNNKCTPGTLGCGGGTATTYTEASAIDYPWCDGNDSTDGASIGYTMMHFTALGALADLISGAGDLAAHTGDSITSVVTEVLKVAVVGFISIIVLIVLYYLVKQLYNQANR